MLQGMPVHVAVWFFAPAERGDKTAITGVNNGGVVPPRMTGLYWYESSTQKSDSYEKLTLLSRLCFNPTIQIRDTGLP